MYEVLCTRDWGPALITDLEHEGLNAKQRSLGSMEKEEKPLKAVEREGQQGKGSRLGGPSADTTSDCSVSLWILRGSRTYRFMGLATKGPIAWCGSATRCQFLPGPYRRPVYPFLLLTAAPILAKGLPGESYHKTTSSREEGWDGHL